MGRANRVAVRVSDGEGKLDGAHQRHVSGIVADAGARRSTHPKPRAQRSKGANLVLRALDNMLHAKFAAADLHHWGSSAGNHRDAYARGRKPLNSQTVTHVERLQGLAFRAEVEPAIRHDTVHVENQESDSGSVFVRHAGEAG
ncbi:MAG TPA: hypothetical protein VMT29_04295 [Steroidobacteraceae bacterium]|nr:hypothetical protein [Steroidobacteraceae bacterium]